MPRQPTRHKGDLKKVFGLVVNYQKVLVGNTPRADYKERYEMVARLAERISSKLHAPTATEWRAFIKSADKKGRGNAWDFLYGDRSYTTDDVAYIRALTRMVVEFVEAV
jgi:hypothetical protein